MPLAANTVGTAIRMCRAISLPLPFFIPVQSDDSDAGKSLKFGMADLSATQSSKAIAIFWNLKCLGN